MKTTTSPMGVLQTTMGEWNNSWAIMPNIVRIPFKTSKPQEAPFFLIMVNMYKNIFSKILINKCWKLAITWNFGQLLKVTLNFKKYLW
jgi:hypothetical protein